MDARSGRDGGRGVGDQIGAIVRVQVVDLHVQLGPALQSSGGQVQIERMIPVAGVADLRTIQLGLAFSGAFEHAPVVAKVQVPTAADGFRFEPVAADDFTQQVHLAWHCDAPATRLPLSLSRRTATGYVTMLITSGNNNKPSP